MTLADFAAHVHAQIAAVTRCERMQLFIHIESGAPYMACEGSDLAQHYTAAGTHIFVGTYNRLARFQDILADLLTALDDAGKKRLRSIDLTEVARGVA